MAASHSSDDDEQQTVAQKAVALIRAPIDVATSRVAIKAYLSTLLVLSASTVLIAISTTAYLLFYYSYVPQLGVEAPIHLQYGDWPYPHATTSLESSSLSSLQPYDISLELHLPRTPNNLAAGNFMLDLALLSRPTATASTPPILNTILPNSTKTLFRSRRPAILPYQSPLLSLTHQLTSLPLHTLGFRDLDADTLNVPMFEHLSFARGWRNIPAAMTFELQSKPNILQVYSARIIFTARFQGLRYILYNYRLVSFLAFTTAFYTVTLASTSIAWLIVSSLLPSTRIAKSKPTTDGKAVKADPDAATLSNGHIKKSPNSHSGSSSSEEGALSFSNLSDSATTFPTLGRQMPLRFPVHRTTDSAASNSHKSSSSRANIAPSGVKREPTDGEQHVLQGTAIEPLPGIATATEAADDEHGEYEDNDRGHGRSSEKDRDSGIGTSMESEVPHPGLQRRRSRPQKGESEGRSGIKREM